MFVIISCQRASRETIVPSFFTDDLEPYSQSCNYGWQWLLHTESLGRHLCRTKVPRNALNSNIKRKGTKNAEPSPLNKNRQSTKII